MRSRLGGGVRRAGEGRVVGGVKGVELIWITATEAVVVKVEVGGGGLVKVGRMVGLS